MVFDAYTPALNEEGLGQVVSSKVMSELCHGVRHGVRGYPVGRPHPHPTAPRMDRHLLLSHSVEEILYSRPGGTASPLAAHPGRQRARTHTHRLTVY